MQVACELAPHGFGVERAIGKGPEHVDQTTFRSKANRDNAYLIDRAVQKTETFSGIDGINVQDRAIPEGAHHFRRSILIGSEHLR